MINTYGFEVGQRVMTAKYKKNLDIYSYKEKEIEDIKNGFVKFKNEKLLHRIEGSNKIGKYNIIDLPLGKIKGRSFRANKDKFVLNKEGDKFLIWVYENGKKRQKEIKC